ncbi:MAG: glycosyltransferase, partial [Acidobacteriota bacterium]
PLDLSVHWGSPRRWRSKLNFLLKATRQLRDGRFDIVHVYCTMGAFLLPIFVGRRSKWIQEHQTGAVSSASRLSRKLQDRLRAWQGRFFDVNFVVTVTLGERLFGLNGKFEVVPAGVNLSLFRAGLPRTFRSELGIPEDAIVFVHAGVLEAERATDIPVRSFAKALARDSRLWLLMPGKGSQLESLRQLARELKVDSRVWLPGYLPYPSIPRIFAAADAGLSYLPNVEYYHGQPPMKVMEYMGAGLPVIASDVPSHRLLIQQEVNGLLVPPDEDSYADALLRFALDSELRRRLAAVAIPSVAHLTYDRIAQERVVPIYQELLQQNRNPEP